MRGLLIIFLQVLMLGTELSAQATFPYNVTIEPMEIAGLPGIHSYSNAMYDGKWILIGGRRDGIHARQPFNAFPEDQANAEIFVVDPLTLQVWSQSVQGLEPSLREQLQATNHQFYQDGGYLLLAGGYGYSPTTEDHITYGALIAVDLELLMEEITNDTLTAEPFRILGDDYFAVTGGALGKIDSAWYLVGGHRFDGRYNPMDHPTFLQEYTNAARIFFLDLENDDIIVAGKEDLIDPVHFHRRDFNMLPQIFAGGKAGYTVFSGVFQYSADLPYLYPVDIRDGEYEPITAFNQYFCNYHSAHAALYDSGHNMMYNIFFGGISQFFLLNGNVMEDTDVPFVNTVSIVARNPEGTYSEEVLPVKMPGFYGASAGFFPDEKMQFAGHEIIDLEGVTGDTSFLLGYIVGGIVSNEGNPFVFNNTGATQANASVFKVFLQREMSSATGDLVGSSYHRFNCKAIPNPAQSGSFRVELEAPESGSMDIQVVDANGVLQLNAKIEGIEEGRNTIEIEDLGIRGTAFITMILNNRYTANTKLILQ